MGVYEYNGLRTEQDFILNIWALNVYCLSYIFLRDVIRGHVSGNKWTDKRKAREKSWNSIHFKTVVWIPFIITRNPKQFIKEKKVERRTKGFHNVSITLFLALQNKNNIYGLEGTVFVSKHLRSTIIHQLSASSFWWKI